MTRSIWGVILVVVTLGVLETRQAPPSFELDEATVAQLQNGMQSGQYTARRLAELYLQRIEAIDRRGPALRSIIEINPDALTIADALDAERKSKGPRGPLHGIPVVIKDNIDTADRMMTTAGSLALQGSIAATDAFIVGRLRAAGAVIIGKTNLSEWANFRSTKSTRGWSGRGGQTNNPYVLDRNPCGSSSGTGAAIAANLSTVGVGTETDGSVVCPSNANSLVGIKPTLGLISRAGIVPIAHSQDTAGPMTRTVADAAVLLGAMIGADPDDPATALSPTKGSPDYTAALDPNGLKGARIGVVRNRLFGSNAAADRLAEQAIVDMKKAGAIFVDPANIPTLGQFDDSEFEVLLYEFKADLNKYLTWLGAPSPVRSLKDVIDYNEAHAAEEMPHFGQEILVMAEKKGPLSDPKYRAARAKNHRLSRALGIDAVMTKHRLDALVAPTGGPAWLIDLVNGDSGTATAPAPSTVTSVAGYPHITVPAGFYKGLPVGVSFFGRAWSEATLIRLAYAYEQATKHRRSPSFRGSAEIAR